MLLAHSRSRRTCIHDICRQEEDVKRSKAKQCNLKLAAARGKRAYKFGHLKPAHARDCASDSAGLLCIAKSFTGHECLHTLKPDVHLDPPDAYVGKALLGPAALHHERQES